MVSRHRIGTSPSVPSTNLWKAHPKEYNSWLAMRRRCYDEGDQSYKRYGGRGVTVCQRWRESFAAFLEDVGPAPSSRHTIDRHPNTRGNYEPGNVRWATKSEQARTTSNARILEHDGVSASIAEWAERTGISAVTIATRLNQGGWPVADALTVPPRGQRPSPISTIRAVPCAPRRDTSINLDAAAGVRKLLQDKEAPTASASLVPVAQMDRALASGRTDQAGEPEEDCGGDDNSKPGPQR